MASCAILSNFFEEHWTQNHPQYLSGLSRALFPTNFLEIAVYKYSVRKGSSFCDIGTLEFPKLLLDAACRWRPGQLSCWLRFFHVFEILLSWHFLFQDKYYFSLYEFLKRWINAFIKKKNSKTDEPFCLRRPYLCPSKGNQHSISIQSFVNLDKTFFLVSRTWNIARSWFLARCVVYWFSSIS